MSDDSSKDAEPVEYIDSQDEDDPDGSEKRPIMLLLRRLIKNKQNTVMTNAQIVDILRSEFNISVITSHELEVDIYVKIIKKYLKDWPQWEELERISTKLNKIKDYEAVSKVLNHKYKNLKEYLDVMLKAAKPLAKAAVNTIQKPGNKTSEDKNIESTDPSDVVMEIQCTKLQLNNLFYRRPRLDLNNTVFNVSNVAPSRISLKNVSAKQIINGWPLKITIDLPHLLYQRELVHKMKHVLVNKVCHEGVPDVTLPMTLQMLLRDQVGRATKDYKLSMIIDQLHRILEVLKTQSDELYSTARLIIETFISELEDYFHYDVHFKIPASFRKYANKRQYVRYLYAENEQSDDPRYDLQLQETVAPMLTFNIRRYGIWGSIPPVGEWLKVECIICKVVLPSIQLLESHYNDIHQNEVDWQCTHCNMMFSIEYLSNNKWYHEC